MARGGRADTRTQRTVGPLAHGLRSAYTAITSLLPRPVFLRLNNTTCGAWSRDRCLATVTLLKGTTMKKLGLLVMCVLGLALPATSLAADGQGGARLEAHLARATAHVAKYVEKCKPAPAERAQRCAERQAKISARLKAWEGRITERIARVEKSDGENKAARLVKLNDTLSQIKNLEAKL